LEKRKQAEHEKFKNTTQTLKNEISLKLISSMSDFYLLCVEVEAVMMSQQLHGGFLGGADFCR